MGYMPYSCGFQRLTSSGVISDVGKPILVTAVTTVSGATAAVPYVNNGTSTSSVIAFRPDGAAAVGQTMDLNLPVMLPNGCYVSFDANTVEVTVFYILQSTSN